ncbi:NLRC3, partial [Symbiodinium pilosum]
MEDMLYELAVCKDLQETGILRTVVLADGTNVTLVGGNHASKASALFAETIVFSVQPSALVLELCSERAGVLIQGNGHRQSRAKSWMNPDEPEWLRRQYATYADETRRAFRAFMKYSKPACRLLVFADMKASVVEHDIENMQERRDANLAANIYRTARLGHKKIVAVLGANHLDGVARELESMQGTKPEHGLYISASGCEILRERQKKLAKKVSVKRWRQKDTLPNRDRDELKRRLRVLCNPEKIWNSLGKHALEPGS